MVEGSDALSGFCAIISDAGNVLGEPPKWRPRKRPSSKYNSIRVNAWLSRLGNEDGLGDISSVLLGSAGQRLVSFTTQILTGQDSTYEDIRDAF